MPGSNPAARDRRIVWWLLLGLVLLFGGLYVAAYFFTGDRIARGTTIGGVDVGGLKPAAAESLLEEELREATDRKIELVIGDASVSRNPADLGLTVDLEGSISQVAVGRSWEPAHLWQFIAGGSSYDVVVDFDSDQFSTGFGPLADESSRPPREGSIRFSQDGRAQAVYPRTGESVDAAAAEELVRAAYPLDTDEPVEIPLETTEATVTAAEVSRVMKAFANPAMSAPVTFIIAGERIQVDPPEYAPALSVRAEDGTLVPRLNKAKLLAVIEPAMGAIAVEPQNAAMEIVDGQPRVVPGRTGVTFDPAVIVDSFLDVVVAQGADRELRVKTKLDAPEYTAKELKALGIKEQVSSFTTYFPYAEYRNTNIGRAAELINGTILQPGETFSLNGIVGERTAENGFVKGYVIRDGILVQDLGGGVSQVATTTFNAAFFAGLKDVEHKPHSFYIDRYPVGREATVAWPTVDLRFTNDTPHGILIQAWRDLSTPSTQGAMNVRMWSTKVWDIKAGQSERYDFTSPDTRHLSGPECEPHSGYGGFDIDVYRYFYRPGSDDLVRKETFHTSYIPSDTVICDG